MAKASKTVKGSKAKLSPVAASGTGGETATYSTRFDSRQRELIEEAAKQLNWAPAKLIREAAVRRAADVMNSVGAAESKLRELASIVLKQLLNPIANVEQIVEGQNGRFTTRTETVSHYAASIQDDGDEDPLEGRFGKVRTVSPVRPHDSELAQIRRAFDAGGSRFVEVLLKEWANRLEGDSEYRPRVSAIELLQGEQGE